MVSLLPAVLFIPLLGAYTAIFLGKSEDYQLSRKSWLLSLIPTALFLAVITNDFHQQVFSFASGIPGVPDNKVFFHRPLYFVSVGWTIGCVFFSVFQLLKKTKASKYWKAENDAFCFELRDALVWSTLSFGISGHP